ncbi:MAG: ABC transporter permease [Sandaracinaceae bacterium]|nr:ABC transporter permease [Sandaracinaceae bacterium]
MRRLLALAKKELWEHGAIVLALLFLLCGIGGLLLVAALVAPRTMSLLETHASFTRFFLPIVALALGNRLVVREYQRGTQRFLEALPVRRVEIVLTKLGLGFFVLSLAAMSSLAPSVLAAMLRGEPLTVRWLALVFLKTELFVLALWTVLFTLGLVGRWRVPVYLGVLFFLIFVDRATDADLGRFGPFALVGERFVLERSSPRPGGVARDARRRRPGDRHRARHRALARGRDRRGAGAAHDPAREGGRRRGAGLRDDGQRDRRRPQGQGAVHLRSPRGGAARRSSPSRCSTSRSRTARTPRRSPTCSPPISPACARRSPSSCRACTWPCARRSIRTRRRWPRSRTRTAYWCAPPSPTSASTRTGCGRPCSSTCSIASPMAARPSSPTPGCAPGSRARGCTARRTIARCARARSSWPARGRRASPCWSAGRRPTSASATRPPRPWPTRPWWRCGRRAGRERWLAFARSIVGREPPPGLAAVIDARLDPLAARMEREAGVSPGELERALRDRVAALAPGHPRHARGAARARIPRGGARRRRAARDPLAARARSPRRAGRHLRAGPRRRRPLRRARAARGAAPRGRACEALDPRGEVLLGRYGPGERVLAAVEVHLPSLGAPVRVAAARLLVPR